MKSCTPDEKTAVLELARHINGLHPTWPAIDRRTMLQNYRLINERRAVAGYHLVGAHPSSSLALTPRLMRIITTCTAAVSITALLAAQIVPYALYIIPLFVLYCAGIVLIRFRLKTVQARY